MDKIFYTNAELTEKSGVPQGSDLPQDNFELLEFDLSSLPSGLAIYDIEWTSEGITTLNLESIAKDKLIKQCDSVRNSITENNILIGFDWPPSGGVRFYMSQENQINFSNLYQLSVQDLLSYPKTIWSGTDTMQLVNKQAVQDFYLAGVAHIELQLDQGLLAKQAFRTMSYGELTQWLSDN